MKRELSEGQKQLFEIAPIIIFIAAYFFFRHKDIVILGESYQGLVIATAIFVPFLILSMIILWVLTGSLSKIQILTLILVVVFGGLTIWFNDERFIKMRPTLVYLLSALILGIGLLRGVSYFKVLIGNELPISNENWIIFTKRYCWFSLVMAGLNELVWRSMSNEIWLFFKFPIIPILLIVFLALNYGLFEESVKNDENREE